MHIRRAAIPGHLLLAFQQIFTMGDIFSSELRTRMVQHILPIQNKIIVITHLELERGFTFFIFSLGFSFWTVLLWLLCTSLLLQHFDFSSERSLAPDEEIEEDFRKPIIDPLDFFGRDFWHLELDLEPNNLYCFCNKFIGEAIKLLFRVEYRDFLPLQGKNFSPDTSVRQVVVSPFGRWLGFFTEDWRMDFFLNFLACLFLLLFDLSYKLPFKSLVLKIINFLSLPSELWMCPSIPKKLVFSFVEMVSKLQIEREETYLITKHGGFPTHYYIQ